ncbi:hypothetical protein LSAT2_018808 [Lamellibrachia satsuma]|nr:hypothetical protein LSAT2_018808 [Lamellibrachia satsuma]
MGLSSEAFDNTGRNAAEQFDNIVIVTETNISSHEFIYELRRCFKQLRRLQANWQHGPPYRNDFATDEQMFEGDVGARRRVWHRELRPGFVGRRCRPHNHV